MRNTLFYGDNLDILRHHIPDESVDLIYLDPPFNSNRNYNVLFKEKSGMSSTSQIRAFTDTWTWNEVSSETYQRLRERAPYNVATMITSMHDFVGENDMMAYLVMMAERLVELYRVLKRTGSFYLHCDPTASHYLKILLDTIFGKNRYMSEISWKRSSAHNDSTQGRRNFGHIRDVVFFYTKSDSYTWNQQFSPYDQSYIDAFYTHIDEESSRRYRLSDLTAAKGGGDTSFIFRGAAPYKGRYWAYSQENLQKFHDEGRLYYSKNGMPSYKRYLDEMPGVPLQDNWDSVRPVTGNERLGYPTQKPLQLLERILRTSSNEGDVVLDPFCGCGTAVIAAQALDRTWLGIDITHLAIGVMKSRIVETFGTAVQFDILGEPDDLGAARLLAERDRHEFQKWAASLVFAQPVDGEFKKGADKGIDGIIRFVDDPTERWKRALVQVKSGKVGSAIMRDLVGTVSRENAEMGMLLTLEPPTQPMIQEAISAGPYESPWWGKYPRIQIASVAQLLEGRQPRIPPRISYRERAARLQKSVGQPSLFD